MNIHNDVVTVTLNPAIDMTISIDNFTPDQVNRVKWSESHPGGKGVNVASFLADAGCSVAVSGFYGEKNSGIFTDFFAQKKIDNQFIAIEGETRTGIKIIDECRGSTTDINFTGLTPDRAALNELYTTIDAFLPETEWFVLSGSVPGTVAPEVYGNLVRMIRMSGKKVAVDTSGAALSSAVKSLPSVIKPNIHELEEFVGSPLVTDAAVIAECRTLIESGIETVIVSMGKEGALFVNQAQTLLVKPPVIKAKSSVGAGDSMLAGFVYGMIKGFSLEQSARYATAFAMARIAEVGARLPELAVLEKLMQGIVVREID